MMSKQRRFEEHGSLTARQDKTAKRESGSLVSRLCCQDS